jgi:hypothetical protein
VIRIKPKPDILKKESEVIIEFISKENVSKGLRDKNPLHTSFNEIYTHILTEQTGRLIYALYNIGFSNKYELMQHVKMNQSSTIYFMDKLWKYKVIERLYPKGSQYGSLMNFWKSEYATGRNKGVFYYINPEFEPVIRVFKSVLESHFNENEIEEIEERKAKWENHLKMIDKQDKAHRLIEESSIGKCELCSALIIAGSKEGRNYFDIKGHLFCRECFKTRQDDVAKLTRGLFNRK